MTSSKPDCLPKTPSLNVITLRVGASAWELGAHSSIHSSPGLGISNCAVRSSWGTLWRRRGPGETRWGSYFLSVLARTVACLTWYEERTLRLENWPQKVWSIVVLLFPFSHRRAGVLFFLTTNQCFSSVSAVELFVVEKKLFMWVAVCSGKGAVHYQGCWSHWSHPESGHDRFLGVADVDGEKAARVWEENMRAWYQGRKES